MLDKKKQSRFGFMLVTPSFLGVSGCPLMAVPLVWVSHRAEAERFGSKV